MTPRDPDISADEMKRLFSYDPETGEITRTSGDKRFFGTVAGYIHHTGYRMLKIGKRSILSQRVAWVLHCGEWPGGFYIDHINRNKLDNRISNLRKATHGQNVANSKTRAASGFKGVYTAPATNPPKWNASISLNGKTTTLLVTENKEEAARAYAKAAKIKYGEFANWGGHE